MTAEKLPQPSDCLIYGGHPPQAKLGVEDGEPVWFILIYGWRGQTFGNHIYKYNWTKYKVPQWVPLEFVTNGRGSLEMENNSLYLFSTQESGHFRSGRPVLEIYKEKIAGFEPEDKGGH